MIRALIVAGLVVGMLGCACARVGATEMLTLTLEAPSLSSPQADSQGADTSTKAQVPEPEPKQPPTENTVTIGRVGVVSVSIAYIYKSKSPSSGKYATVKADTPLVITKDEDVWYGVLMNNGATGWIPKKNVTLAGYDIVAKKPEGSRGSLASRGGQPMRGVLSEVSGNDVIRTAMQYGGVRYLYGGTRPEIGMDCSAFVRMVFGRHGIRLPRTAREQAQVGKSVPYDQLQPGDRLYFSCRSSHIDHCGIYAGRGYFIHCSAARHGVGVDTLASDFYWRSLVTARRS